MCVLLNFCVTGKVGILCAHTNVIRIISPSVLLSRHRLPIGLISLYVVFRVWCFHVIFGVPRFPLRLLLYLSSLCIRMGEGVRCVALGAASVVRVHILFLYLIRTDV